jgi:L-2,4-diaminobutyric acid acetyltransferase
MMNSVEFKPPEVSHASQISRLVRETPKLDDNSEYIYALWCAYFARNSAVAVNGDEVLAFVTGFRSPASPEVYFLWQTAAKSRHGIPNLGVDLIQYAAEREIATGARIVEASVDAKNKPMTILMKTLCKRLGGDLETEVLFDSETLSANGSQHHEETLYRIRLWDRG